MSPAPLTGAVRHTGGGVYGVALDDGRTVEASLRGRVKLQERQGDRVVIGDRVRLHETDGAFTIEEVAERSTTVVRRGRGGRRAKVVAANVDRVVAVAAALDPAPSLETIDRLLVIAEADMIHAMVVVNKLDLDGAREVAEPLARLYRALGYPVHLVSAKSGEGLAHLREVFCQGTSALVGPSGSGKSTILNAVEPGLDLRTGGLSRKLRRGRHTTVSARMIPLSCGGLVADTPGFGEVGLWGVAADEVASCFPEFRSRMNSCRYRDCSHVTEPDCTIREAVASGDVPESRYLSYLAVLEEAREEPGN